MKTRLIARKGVILDTAKARQLGLTWGQRKDGAYLMTKEGWKKAVDRQMVVSATAFGEAASRIASRRNDLACIALADVAKCWSHTRVPEARFFCAVLEPANANLFWYGPHSEPTNRMARTLGLLLCAELVKEGFQPDGWPQ